MILSHWKLKLKAMDNVDCPLPTDLFPWSEVQEPSVQVGLRVEQTHPPVPALAPPKHLSLLFPSLLNFIFCLLFILHISLLFYSLPPLLILFHPDRHWFESNFDGIPSAALTMRTVKWRRTTTGHGWLQGQLWSLIVSWLSTIVYSPIPPEQLSCIFWFPQTNYISWDHYETAKKYTQSLVFIEFLTISGSFDFDPAAHWPCVNCLCRAESRKVWAGEWMPRNRIMTSREEGEASRREILGVLARKGFQGAESTNFYHGRLKYFLPHLKPRITWPSKASPRGPGAPSWVTASELQVRRFFTQTSELWIPSRRPAAI